MVEEYKIYILKKANEDKEKIKQFSSLKNNVEKLINLIKKNPFQIPPSYEILTKDLKRYYSRRINKQHRLVYEVIEEEKRINIISMWTHYEI
ncbi:Txe/YoeB family addiction module toxin [Leptotrichia massiliensis]|uniref:Txe/YoeB family addiction module toxin n=1 Tax=Leptotrichia massiliensis TaxID=1852388 RepID=UPI0028D73B5F|nr:Txe/YoeB family addiction module toxin [Leptotrichia massiliensis]